MKNVYGLSRSRDHQGNVVKRSLNPFVNCLHTQVGSARDNMEVYVIEIMESPKIISMPHGYNKGSIKDIAPTHTANAYQYNNFVLEPYIAAMRGRNPDNPSERGRSNGNYKQRLEVNENGTSNTLTSVQKDNLVVEPLRIPEATKKGYAETYEGDSINLALPNSTTRRGRVGHQQANTLDTSCNQGVVANYRIRKLTPRECFRLMGVSETDIDKMLSAGISNSQLYKLAGNSIVVDVLYHIFRKMFIEKENEHQQLTLF